MDGVRLLEVAPGTSRKHIEEFLKDTGLEAEMVYYPLLNNDAVVLFKDSKSSAKALCCKLKKATHFVVRPLPHKIFSRVTVYLEDGVVALLSSSEEYNECNRKVQEMTNKRMQITKEKNGGMIMTGDIYDVELAQRFLSDFFENQSDIQHKMVNGHDPAVNKLFKSSEKPHVPRGLPGSTQDDKLKSAAARDTNSNGFEEELTGRGFSLDRMTSIDDDVRGRGSRDQDASKTFNEFTGMSSMHSENISGRVVSPETSGISRNQQMDAAAMTSLKSYSFGAGGDQLDNLCRHQERGIDEEFTSSMFDRNATMLREMDQIPKKELKDVEAWVNGQKTTNARDLKVSPIPSPRTHIHKGLSHSGDSPDKVAITNVIQRRRDVIPGASKEKSYDYLQFSFKLYGDVTVKVYYGNIINSQTDGIVNAANPNLEHHAGVAGALERACGRDMKRECERYILRNGALSVSRVMHTTAGDLHGTRYIMHTVGPVFIKSFEQSCGNQLTCTFLRCLDYAHKNLVIRSVAFPFISTGVFDVPVDICIEAFLDAVVMFFHSYHADTCLREVHLVNTDVEMVQTAIVMLKQHLEQGVDTLVERALSRLQSNTAVDRSPRSDSKYSNSPKRRSASLTRDRRHEYTEQNYKTLTTPIDRSTNSLGYSAGEKEKLSPPFTPHRERSGSTGARPKSSPISSTTNGRKINSNSKVDVSKTMPSKYSMAIGSTNIEKMKKTQSSQGSNSPRSGPMKATRTTGLEDTNSYQYDKEGTDQYYGTTGMDEERFHSLPADLTRQRSAKQYSYLSGDARAPSTEKDDKCSICMDTMTYPKKLSKCGHSFCEDCISQALAVKPVCPMCGKLYGVMKGDQPEGGTMTSRVDTSTPLAGYRDAKGMIIIEYKFPSGKQQSYHPNPRTYYSGIQRTAYLPNNREGREVLRLLEKSFEARLTFTIGYSRTTGQTGVITWNDIHHKTSPTGGSTGYGYPDPDYLKRVKEELSLKGITT